MFGIPAPTRFSSQISSFQSCSGLFSTGLIAISSSGDW
nr:MAG TPA: hypothetical protein [Caudoviricetes sp.]DAT04530.1 MAG TPA: hypothetical protein [Bacteriophage sp.]